MDAESRAAAEKQLTEAAAAHGCADPRPPYRERLRRLRESHPDAFSRAVAHYESTVLPALTGANPLETWARYGEFLAGLTGEGRLTALDATGRAAPWSGQPDALVLFIPDEPREDVLTILQPLRLTDAQSAAIELLVNRKLALG